MQPNALASARGTRMPAAWPGGKSQLDAIFDGDTVKQVESIWVYLSDGPNAVPLRHMRALLEQLVALDRVVKSQPLLENDFSC